MNACASALVRRLAQAGGWLARQALQQDIGWSEGRVDDELADLVLCGQVQYQERGRQYRLAGASMGRRALRDLVAPGNEACQRVMLGAQSLDKAHYRVGLALRSTDAAGAELLTMGELELPYPQGDPAELARMAGALVGLARTHVAAGQAPAGEPAP